MLDAGALIAIERGDRDIARRLRRSADRSQPVLIPASCLAQVWRDGSRQARLTTALKEPTTSVIDLDGSSARRIGEMLGRATNADVVDAHAALVVERTGGTILTSDPDDIRRLAPGVRIVTV